MIHLKPRAAGRQAAQTTSLSALLREPAPSVSQGLTKQQSAEALRKANEDRFFVDYTASLVKSSRADAVRRAEQLRKAAATTEQPATTFEVITNQGELHALIAQQDHAERQAVVDAIKRSERVNAITGARLP
jgi:hypothetical protein